MGKKQAFTEADEAVDPKAANQAVIDGAKSQEERKVALATGSGSVITPISELREMSLDQLMAAFPGATDATEAIGTDQYGPILEDKGQLVGKPLVLVHWEFYKGDFSEDFASMWVMTNDGAKYIVNDGSTGIRAQLRELTRKTGQNSMLVCKHGLRVSEYDYTDQAGKTSRARTYYIDTKL